MPCSWKGAALLVIGVALTACQTAGQGTITLSAPVAAAFEEYKKVKFPEKSFAVSQDGLEYQYVWCEHAACGGSGSMAAEAIRFCDRDRRKYNSSEQPCRVFAVGNQVVWEGNVTFPDTVVAYRLNPAEGFRPRGPEQTRGAVIYVPGFDPDYNFPPDDNSVPTYVASLHSSGWDAFKAVPNNDDIDGPLTHERAAEGVARHIADLRAAGYQRVAVAAQSFGSWAGLVGGANAETWADVNILSVPSCCGPKVIDGKVNEYFQRNRPELRRVLRELKMPTILIYFAGDVEFEDPAFGQIAKDVLGKNGIDHLVFDRPPGFSGHSAAWTVQFDFVFGECIAEFAAGNGVSTACDGPEVAAAQHLWVESQLDLEALSPKLVTEQDLLENIGNTIIGYRSDGHRAAYYLRSETETVAHLRQGYGRAREVMVPSRIDGDLLCLPECYKIYQWGDDYVRAVDERGNTAFEGTVMQGNPRGIGQNAPAT